MLKGGSVRVEFVVVAGTGGHRRQTFTRAKSGSAHGNLGVDARGAENDDLTLNPKLTCFKTSTNTA